MSKPEKTLELVTPPCVHGKALARITDGDESYVTQVTRVEEGKPLQPGDTIMRTEAIAGNPRRRKVTSEYTSPGPARVATPAYRKGYDKMKWN